MDNEKDYDKFLKKQMYLTWCDALYNKGKIDINQYNQMIKKVNKLYNTQS